MDVTKPKLVTLFEGSSNYNDFPFGTIQDVKNWLDKKMAAIPEEYRDKATVEFYGGDTYGNPCVFITISYVIEAPAPPIGYAALRQPFEREVNARAVRAMDNMKIGAPIDAAMCASLPIGVGDHVVVNDAAYEVVNKNGDELSLRYIRP